MSPSQRVLILGGGGRVGRLLCGAWRQDPSLPELVVQSRHPGPGITFVQDPAPGNEATFLKAVAAVAPDTVVALWGVTPHSTTKDLSENSRLALLALKAAQVSGARRVVLTSTGAVYSPSSRGHRETDRVDPPSAYGRAKWQMEQAAADGCRVQAAAPTVTILRLANVIGADLLGDVVRQAAGRCGTDPQACLTLDRFPDGFGPRRSYLSPRTLARCVSRIAASASSVGGGVYNLADGNTVWDMSAVLRALERAGYPVAWKWAAAPDTALPVHGLNTDLLTRDWPELKADFCQTPDALVADWLAAGGGTP
ncbi:NAD(P)-dependent oxidoreductase [Pseudoruegeria sp. SK021]|uniref:NAD-dependent epimerase/dehydratase family protein n=1 Tax=Pseudoruegeria sp. SK021 TaxID=1933035 RepID=UPI000A2451F3|nr:NAD(P)-dependent oxidoreductase [Pseudoruegeria sp. SK021]OSP56814.1 hypothetical protein BV911_02420 [Pseudoruegeria sp. SK021]